MDMDTNGFELGDVVEDPIWKITGTIIGFTQWMTGCARATIVRGYGPDGKELDNHGQDVLLLTMVTPGPRHTVDASIGGPHPEPPRQR